MALFNQTPYTGNPGDITFNAGRTDPLTVVSALAKNHKAGIIDLPRYQSPLMLGGYYFNQHMTSPIQGIIAPPKFLLPGVLPSGTI